MLAGRRPRSRRRSPPRRSVRVVFSARPGTLQPGRFDGPLALGPFAGEGRSRPGRRSPRGVGRGRPPGVARWRAVVRTLLGWKSASAAPGSFRGPGRWRFVRCGSRRPCSYRNEKNVIRELPPVFPRLFRGCCVTSNKEQTKNGQKRTDRTDRTDGPDRYGRTDRTDTTGLAQPAAHNGPNGLDGRTDKRTGHGRTWTGRTGRTPRISPAQGGSCPVCNGRTGRRDGPDGRTNGRTDRTGHTDERTDGPDARSSIRAHLGAFPRGNTFITDRTDGRTDGQTDGRTDGQTDVTDRTDRTDTAQSSRA
jgi:hypothetical protein